MQMLDRQACSCSVCAVCVCVCVQCVCVCVLGPSCLLSPGHGWVRAICVGRHRIYHPLRLPDPVHPPLSETSIQRSQIAQFLPTWQPKSDSTETHTVHKSVFPPHGQFKAFSTSPLLTSPPILLVFRATWTPPSLPPALLISVLRQIGRAHV